MEFSIQFRGRRYGRRLSASRKDTYLKVISNYGIKIANFNLDNLISNNYQYIHLEIGPGKGEYIVNLAKQFQNDLFIASEPYINGIANIAVEIDKFKLKNLFIFPDDARLLLAKIPNNRLKTVYLFFPDPWPKFRHRNRRFINQDNLNELSRVLKKGGNFWFASDHYEYCRWALYWVRKHPDFEWNARKPRDWQIRPNAWIPTRYEAKSAINGINPVFLKFNKC